MREIKFKFVFRHPDGETIITPAYTLDEILQTNIEDIQDTWINCDCVPVGERGYVECNCDERFGQFQLIAKLESTGLTDGNECNIFEGDILNCFINDSPIGNLDKVEFKDGAFILGYRQVSLLEWMTMPNDEYGSGLEVIGNIYQNYDLLTPTT